MAKQADGADASITPLFGDTASRLNEKILDAFNHAYAIGAAEIASRLRALLEASGGPDATPRGLETSPDLLDRAERWTAFVEARDAYRRVLNDPRQDADSAERALARMKETYRIWSLG